MIPGRNRKESRFFQNVRGVYPDTSARNVSALVGMASAHEVSSHPNIRRGFPAPIR